MALSPDVIALGPETPDLNGRYVVYCVVYQSPSQNEPTRHPSRAGGKDNARAGHGATRVYCESLDDSRAPVDFYQSGQFDKQVDGTAPVGQAE